MLSSKKLNLGCGEFFKSGYINVDLNSISSPDVKHDLNVFPYPFEDDSFSLIELDHVLEHLSDPFSVMRELHRIAENDALVIIRVPHFSRGFTHPEHKRGFDVSFPLYFNPSFQGGYQKVEFKLQNLRLKWFAQPELKKTVISSVAFTLASMAGRLIDCLANHAPFFMSRIACFWVGGFEEVEFKLRVVKESVEESLRTD